MSSTRRHSVSRLEVLEQPVLTPYGVDHGGPDRKRILDHNPIFRSHAGRLTERRLNRQKTTRVCVRHVGDTARRRAKTSRRLTDQAHGPMVLVAKPVELPMRICAELGLVMGRNGSSRRFLEHEAAHPRYNAAVRYLDAADTSLATHALAFMIVK